MRNETAAQKEKRMFESYKSDLERLGKEGGFVRMNVVEYVCSFPEIDPYKMAAAIVSDGFEVLFDDSSISQKENERKRKAVEKMIA